MNSELLPRGKRKSQFSPCKKPMNSVEEFHRQINEIFNNMFGDDAWFETRCNNGVFVPRFEVNENNNLIEISAELPGVEKNELGVSVNNGILCVNGKKSNKFKFDDESYHFTERHYGSFRRSFVLPDGLDLEKLDAGFKNGVLKISLPKSEGKQKSAKTINIKHEQEA